MEFDAEKLHGLIETFSEGHIKPPLPVVHAIAALAADEEMIAPLSVRDRQGVAEQGDELKTTWECMALVGDAVLKVSASRVGGDWYWDDFEDDGDTPAVFGDLIPLREIAACRLLQVRSFGLTSWVSRWQLDLRGRDSVGLPWPQYRQNQERHDVLGRAIAAKLR